MKHRWGQARGGTVSLNIMWLVSCKKMWRGPSFVPAGWPRLPETHHMLLNQPRLLDPISLGGRQRRLDVDVCVGRGRGGGCACMCVVCVGGSLCMR